MVQHRILTRAALDTTMSRFGAFDVVVNNAGYANVSPIETAHDKHEREQFETNFFRV